MASPGSSCRLGNNNACPRDKDESEDEGLPPSPSTSRSLRSSAKAPASTGTAAKGAMLGRRSPDADTMPLYLAGSVGALFKIRLSSYGYTLVAKGVEQDHIPHLQHERKVCDKLRTIQGKYVPVCLGEVDLVLPYYYDGGVFVRLLFLGWAGPLLDLPSQVDKNAVIGAIRIAFKAVHHLRVLHGDAEPGNILYSADSGNIMIVDFERAKLIDREPLGLIS